MMKFLFMLLFLMPLSFIGSGFWFNQCLFMVMILLFFSQLSHSVLFCSVSCVWGVDLLSFVMIFLSFWVCSLMILASSVFMSLAIIMIFIYLFCLFYLFLYFVHLLLWICLCFICFLSWG